MHLRLDIVALFVIGSSDCVKAIFVEVVAKRVVVAAVLLEDVKAVFIVSPFSRLNGFLGELLQIDTPSILVECEIWKVDELSSGLFRVNVVSELIVEASLPVDAVGIEVVAQWVVEAAVFEDVEAILIVSALQFLDLLFGNAFKLIAFYH